MTDTFWRDQEKYKKILDADFKMFSKHVDQPRNRDQILDKLKEILQKQIEIKALTRKEAIDRSFFLFSKRWQMVYPDRRGFAAFSARRNLA